MGKYDGLSPPVVSLVVSPILELSKVIELGSSSIVLKPITAFFVEPTVHDFYVTLALVITLLLEFILDLLFASFSHSEIIGAIKLKVVPLVVLSKILTCIVGARLVVILLETELCELSHRSVRANKPEGLFVFAHVNI